nr:MAG TPA: hypothetical protein [Caudoviricetes sp.]
MATEEITISELELADEVLADMTLPVDTATETRAVTLKQLRAWLGSSLPTGFIIPAVGKISDERFTLLDGKTLSRAGTYEAFCNKVVSEVQAGNWFACSEDEYAQDLSDFGQCGKFVVSNDYIRIPTITRFIGATITLSEIGKTYKESLPNITGSASSAALTTAFALASGAVKLRESLTKIQAGASYNMNASIGFEIDASRSSSTYQDGAKVQPDHTKYPYYMVISTEGQTENVEIDINKVYEDMNLKANTSLSNLTAEGKSLASGLGMPSDRYIDLTLGASGATYTAIANGWVVARTDGKGGYVYLINTTSLVEQGNDTPSANIPRASLIPVRKGDVFGLFYNTPITTFRFVYAEGEN